LLPQVHRLLSGRINDWSYRNWTSQLRVEDGHPPFREPERDFTDFTYQDSSGHMKALLRDAGVELDPLWSTETTYRLEVKTTMLEWDEPFIVSQNQIDLVRFSFL